MLIRTVVWAAAVCLLLTACSAQPRDWSAQGRVTAMDGQVWVVDGHLVSVSAQVRVAGQRSAAGELRAERVEVIDAPPQAAPTPAAVAPPTVRPTTIRPTLVPARPAAPPPAPKGGGERRDHGRD
jgi:starvation-inducible outer membrane lipoprotein